MSIWLVISICFLPILLFLSWSKKYREKNPDIFGYILSLIGTFVGVAVGLYFSDLAAAKDKRQRAVKVLEASKEEMEWLVNRAKIIDTVTQQQKKYYYLEMPPFFAETLRSELLAETLHPKTMEHFNVLRENLLFDVSILKKDINNKNIKALQQDLVDYKGQINQTIKAIDLEIDLLNNKIKPKAFETVTKNMLDSLMKN